jgi:hypothetical protein
MSVAALSTAGFTQYIAASSNVSASQKAFQSLQQNLASGNLTAAQSAFTTYRNLNQSPTTASPSSISGSGPTGTTSQFSTDMTALGSAIGSGNLSTAQSAFATLQSTLQSAPSQAITNAESAVAQTVQSVDDLLNLSSSSNYSAPPIDPTTSILDSAYGMPSATSSTNPTTSILDNAYDAGGAASGSGAASNTSSIASSGNSGSGAGVNAYA